MNLFQIKTTRMRTYFSLAFLLLAGCYRPLPPPTVVSIDPAFQQYVNDFVADGQSVGVDVAITNLSIQFTNDLVAETLGECNIERDINGNVIGTPSIVIDAQDWPTESPDYRKVVLYHELGHCVLMRQHVFTGTILAGYCSATSIMYPDIQSQTNMYTENWAWYVQEMFYPGLFDFTSQSSANYCYYNNYWGGT